LPKRDKLPITVRFGGLVAKNVEISVIGAKLDKRVFRAVPLIENLFD